MATINVTEVKALTYALALAKGEDVPTEFTADEYAAKLSTMLDKRKDKSSKSGVSAADLNRRKALTHVIISTLETCNRPVTVSELQRMTPELQTFENGEIISGQRITSLIKPLVAEGRVENIKDKKKSLFALVRE